MFQTIFLGISLLSNLITGQPSEPVRNVLAQKEYSMLNRQPDKWVNGVFADNILLTLFYLRGNETTSSPNWDEVRKPFHYEFKLNSDEAFAFHDDLLPQFEAKVKKTTNAHFGSNEGFKYDGWLVGDGVCQLASFINMAARAAGLDVLSPTNHNFARIPDVPWEFGVSIFNLPGKSYSDEMQNLYIRNNKEKEITLAFDYKNDILKISVLSEAEGQK